MKLKIKEISFNSGKFNPEWPKLIIAILGIIIWGFKNEILAILKSL